MIRLIENLLGGLPDWAERPLVAVLAALLGVAIALLAHAVLFRILHRVTHRSASEADDIVVNRLFRPTRWAFVAMGVVAALAVLPAALYNRPRWRFVAMPTALGGVFFHFVALIETMVAAHHALPVDTHESLSLLGLLLAVAFLGLAVRYKTVAFGRRKRSPDRLALLPDGIDHGVPGDPFPLGIRDAVANAAQQPTCRR